MDTNIRLIVIDSFCGAGGVTEGFERAEIDGVKIAKVVIGINHDAMAIESHAANHPETYHFVEDFTTLDPHRLTVILDQAKNEYPNAKVLFWASAECTHHSKAKGGLPRDADSRSLPEHIERYVKVLNPDIIGVENVREFLDWGPLNESGKPIKDQKGIYFNSWKNNLLKYGYSYEHRSLNAADFGAYTSRIRYFGLFSKSDENIVFPVHTHDKTGKNGLPKWKAVKDVLDLDKEGESIFARKKPLVDATLRRIIAGIKEFAIKEQDDFLLKYNSMNRQKKCKCPSVDNPSPVISCQDRIALVKTKFLSLAYSGSPKDKNFSLLRPAYTITTIDHHQMLTAYYGNGFNAGLNVPSPTVTTKDRFGLVSARFMDQKYGKSKPSSLNQPNGCLTTTPKQNLYTCRWLLNPQFSCKGASINKPCFTLIARMDKMPPYLMQTVHGNILIKINPEDSEIMKDLKNLCNQHGIIDIMMRMLFIDELLRIMGFGDDYILKGTKAQKKKFIGNAVECTQAKVLAEAIASTISLNIKQAI